MIKSLFSLIFTVCVAVVCSAAEPTASELVIEMNRAQRDGDYLGALVQASALLKINPDHRVAKDFVHNYYQRMDQQSKERIAEIAFSEDAAELEEICEIYRKLNAINENLSEVEMPLKGGNKITGEWVWQPEIQYYRGHYDKARTRVFDMYCRIAKAAVKEQHFDAAYTYYQKALNNFLLSDEYPTQLQSIVNTCREMASIDSESVKTEELVRAYSTYQLIGQLDPKQVDVAGLQKELLPRIANGYISDANKLINSELVSDLELAYEYLQTAIDWDESVASSIAGDIESLRSRIDALSEQSAAE